jgi:simple sugar transport system permease protein
MSLTELLLPIPLLLPTLQQSVPLILAGLGGIFSERAGVINIALEGMMLTAAFAGMWVGQSAGAAAGLGAALFSGMAMGLVHLLCIAKLRMHHIISGAALNILSLNACRFLLQRYFIMVEPPRETRLDARLSMDLFLVLAVLLPLLVHWVLYRTPFGLRLRAVGESPESARMAGVDARRMRLIAVLLSGLFAAGGGGYLSMAQSGRFSDDMVSGRGFIALAAVICGRWTPLGAAAVAIVFGFFDALQIKLQGTVSVPGEFLRMTPYLFTILAAVMLKSTPPAALGREPESA